MGTGYKTIQNTWKAVLKKAELEFSRIHDVRHSVITYQLNEGVPAIKIAEMVGQDVNTTNRTYAQKIRKGKVVDFEAH